MYQRVQVCQTQPPLPVIYMIEKVFSARYRVRLISISNETNSIIQVNQCACVIWTHACFWDVTIEYDKLVSRDRVNIGGHLMFASCLCLSISPIKTSCCIRLDGPTAESQRDESRCTRVGPRPTHTRVGPACYVKSFSLGSLSASLFLYFLASLLLINHLWISIECFATRSTSSLPTIPPQLRIFFIGLAFCYVCDLPR